VAAELSLALLGPPVVTRRGRPVSFDTRKATAVLALLAVDGRELSRERLAALLWPEADTTRARASLRRTLSVTAAAAGGGLKVTRTAVALEPSRVRVDVTEFETLATGPGAGPLDQAIRLYRDDFLAGFALRGCPEFDDWQATTADRLRQELAGALERLVAACVTAGDLAQAVDHARRWLSLDKLHEPAHQALIRLQAWTGQRSAALRQYRALVGILDSELAVRPLPETTRLYDDVRADRLPPPPAQTPGPQTPAQLTPGPQTPAQEIPGRQTPGLQTSVQQTPGPQTPAQQTHARPAPGPAGSAGPESPSGAATWPLVGRDGELRALHHAWREVAQAGRVVAVVGETGCGKTRLIEEFRSDVQVAGGTVLIVRCHDGESALPFAVAADLLHSALSVCPGLPALLPAHAAAMAGRLAPELSVAHRDTPAPPLDSPVALTRLYGAIGEALHAATRSHPGGPGAPAAAAPPRAAPPPAAQSPAAPPPAAPPGVVVVEDVHWADGPSLDLLAYLTRRLAAWPVLLVVSWASEHAPRLRGLRPALSEASSAAAGAMIKPAPLDAAQIDTLLKHSGVADADVARLLEQTRGLPMLVREYVEGLSATAGRGGDSESWWPPASVRELLRGRLEAASEPTLQMLSTAAVLGSGCDADLLRVVSGRGETETVEALDEAVRRFLVIEVPPAAGHGEPSYDFPYEALRDVVYESSTLARRRLLHGRAADALARRYERDPVTTRAATIAEHLQRGGRDAEAAQWWWRAAQRARELYAHAEALAHLRQAVALGYPAVPGSTALGEVLTVLGRYREALAEFETAAAGSGDDHATLATIEHKLAEVHHRLGDWALADAHLGMALDLLAAEDLGRRASVQADLAVVAYRRNASDGRTSHAAGRLGLEALDTARRAGDPAATAQALNVLGMLAARSGDDRAAEERLRESLDQARRLPDHSPAVAALNNLARLLADAGRTSEALGLATEALALGSELGDQHRMAALHTNLADLLHASGQGEAALRHLKEAARGFAAVDTGGPPRPEIWTLVEW
jgi:DNA-binding SARP family transcriptional activator